MHFKSAWYEFIDKYFCRIECRLLRTAGMLVVPGRAKAVMYSGLIVEHYFDNLLPDSQPLRNRLQARVGADSGRCVLLQSEIPFPTEEKQFRRAR